MMDLGIIAALNPDFYKKIVEQERARDKRRLKEAEFVPWDNKIKWQPELNIQAKTYHPLQLFKLNPCVSLQRVRKPKRGEFVDSPEGNWRYVHSLLKKGQKLSTWYGSKIGDIMFDGDVVIPSIFKKDEYQEWNVDAPWMSISPAEIISLRGGTRRAKGDVIVAGLGLGHQLMEVAARKKVKSITLVEIDQELVDWLVPVIEPIVTKRFNKPLKVIVGNAYKVMPKLTADVALVDIFKDYGNNDWEQRDLRNTCPNIKYIWCWGVAAISGGYW
jgi:hypothetical protein